LFVHLLSLLWAELQTANVRSNSNNHRPAEAVLLSGKSRILQYPDPKLGEPVKSYCMALVEKERVAVFDDIIMNSMI